MDLRARPAVPGCARQCPAVPGRARLSAAMTPPFQAFSSRAGLQEDVRMWQAQTPSNYPNDTQMPPRLPPSYPPSTPNLPPTLPPLYPMPGGLNGQKGISIRSTFSPWESGLL